MRSFDVAILGLGAMGSAAAYHMASRGQAVVGFDRFRPPHTMGSSHGETRIYRHAYWEDPAYVPLLTRAYDLWRDLETASGRTLRNETGILLMGVPDGEVIPGATKAAKDHGLTVETPSRDALRARWPPFQPTTGMQAVLEPKAGALFPERCIEAHLGLAQDAGARLLFKQPVAAWRATDDGVVVETADGAYEADRLVVAAGAWSDQVVGDLGVDLEVERQVQYWFPPGQAAGRFAPDACPVWAFEPEPGRLVYGFPDFGTGVKAAIHHEGAATEPDTLDRHAVSAEETDSMRRLLRTYVPDLDVTPRATAVCMYTNTPDRHFIVDRHPEHENVVVAAGFSGHGFKFASVLGEAVAHLASDETPPYDLGLFRLGRFR